VGADISYISTLVLPVGKVFVQVRATGNYPAKSAGDGTTLPQHFTKPYKLTVSSL
jgi:hypothetical protein